MQFGMHFGSHGYDHIGLVIRLKNTEIEIDKSLEFKINRVI